MKIALYIEDGREQIVLTPQTETERSILAKMHDGSRSFELKRGSFFDCRGGWTRFRDGDQDDSTMIILKAEKEPGQ